MIKMLRGFWVDERGSGETFSAIGIVIGMVVLAGIVVGIGITVGKTKMSGVADDITNFKVSLPDDGVDTNAVSETFRTIDGLHTLTEVEIEN